MHVVTVNDYLAQYQSELMGRIYRFMNMDVGLILPGRGATAAEKRKSYAAMSPMAPTTNSVSTISATTWRPAKTQGSTARSQLLHR